VTSLDNLRFEPFAPLPAEERLAILATLRDHRPVYPTESGMWVVTRYDDVHSILRHPQLFSSSPNASEGSGMPTDAAEHPEQMEVLMSLLAGFPSDVPFQDLTSSRTIVAADPPAHTRMRQIVNRGFTPPRIAELAETIDRIVAECLAGIGSADRYEVVEQLATPLPVRMIATLLGFDADHYDKVKEWSDAIATGAVGDVRGTTEGAIMVANAFRDFSTYVAPLIEARRHDPKGDMISAMVRSMESDTLSTVEAIMMSTTVMVAGNETSTNLIGNALVELWRHPDQLRLLQEDPDLLPSAVAEANRLTNPIQFMFREALDDVTLSGTVIPKGATIAVHLASANRDPRHFDRPDTFDITRPPDHGLSFGHGIHYCLGAHLATHEVRSAVGGLLPHLPRFDLDLASLRPKAGVLLNGWERIELVAR
jgi:cytochrome P450